jgi:hypothetical protein
VPDFCEKSSHSVFAHLALGDSLRNLMTKDVNETWIDILIWSVEVFDTSGEIWGRVQNAFPEEFFYS